MLALGSSRIGPVLVASASTSSSFSASNPPVPAYACVQTILPQLFEACQRHRIPATFFELTTALAFQKFQQAQCDAVVLEVGLGGRLDATNIVTPALSIITAIQHDHTRILGESLEQIAAEKAGIIKPGVDVLVGPGCPDIIRQIAASRSAPVFGIDVLSHDERRYRSSSDDTESLNTDLAHAAMHRLLSKRLFHSISPQILSTPSLQAALQARPICRFECFRVTATAPSCHSPGEPIDIERLHEHGGNRTSRDVVVVLDIAHNVDAMKALVQRIRSQFPKSSVR